MTTPELSVIIPTLDEAEHLPLLFADLAAQQGIVCEVIVADGGSTDTTCAIAEGGGGRLVRSERGRGRQMNTAAQQAAGRYLLFLHADSRLTGVRQLADAVAALAEEINRQGATACAGHFRVRFARSRRGNELAYAYAEGKSALNRANTTNGDQGLLLTAEYFRALGGFTELLPYLEDQQIIGRIRASGGLITLPGEVLTSARRFEVEGFHRRYLLMCLMMVMYHLGAHSFFRRAPGVYNAQRDTGKLLLTPFFRIIWQMLREEWGWAGTLTVFSLVGCFASENTWQLFYFLDVLFCRLTGFKRQLFLPLYDRYLAKITGCRLFVWCAGLACFFWFMLMLPLYFWLVECGGRTVARRV
jgi:rSAM/selenodomain-associated transferase 2